MVVFWCLRCELCANLVQLVRIQIRVPEDGWTMQKIFHLMNFVVNGLRAVLFGLYKSVFAIRAKALEQMLMELPSLLFFSTCTLLVLFWAEIYHEVCLLSFGRTTLTVIILWNIFFICLECIQARSEPSQKLRPAYVIINGFIYLVQICLWIYMWIYMIASKPATGLEAAELFLSVISFFSLLGFLLYGGRLFFLLRRFPIESRGRQKKLYEVGSVTSICCTCFLIRCALLAFSVFGKNTDLDVLNHPILNLVYYLMVEIVPSALVLFILRKLPPRRVSDQYHPIR
ncbi:tobamovirus multiplication protein 1 isoform X2 [Vigna angularis]|uniref:tobamovirus multiplication protein 1 isoform X2 n=1 Tax=Phaseolus angularis TaxID=3914 RepID=UPI000809B647|nr:tobamovirus multiplication protein 1 isoform X2 [Vigna angularis]